MNAPAPFHSPLRLFFSYSDKDQTTCDRLKAHLSILQRQGLIEVWHDRKISAGREWSGVIDDNLEVADIVVLLLSSDFLASGYCYDDEMKRAL